MGHFASYYKSKLSYVPFVPTDIAGCQLWLDAGQGITLNGSNVSQWNDLSSAGNHGSQSVVSAQPLYNDNFLNGKPALYFDGADKLNLNSTIVLTSGFSVFAVYRSELASVISVVFGKNTYGYSFVGEYSNHLYAQMVSPVFIRCSHAANTNWKTLNINTSTSSGDIYINGIEQNAEITGTLDNLQINNIAYWNAASAYLKGYIAELIIYNTILQAGDRETVESYLKTKYNHY